MGSGWQHVDLVGVWWQAIFDKVKSRDPDQKEFLQAVDEVITTLEPVLKKRPELIPILEKLCEPERQIMFRVPWCVLSPHVLFATTACARLLVVQPRQGTA